MKKNNVLALISPIFALSAFADPVDNAQITTFQSGTPATAADINQNFQALIDAINDNAVRIAQLEAAARIPGRTLLEQVSGSVYQFYVSELGTGTASALNGTSPNQSSNKALYLWAFGEQGTLTFNTDGTLSFSSNFREREIEVTTQGSYDGSVTPAYEQVNTVKIEKSLDDTDTAAEVGTWSLSGQDLTFITDGESTVLKVSPDGETLMLGESSDSTAGSPFGTDIGMLSVSTILGTRINPMNLNLENFDGSDYAHQSNYTAETGESVTLRLVNLGDSDLTSLSLAVTGGLSITNGLSATSVGPGAHQLITVTYSGGTAKLTITSDDTDTPSYEINFQN
jgi:hypothetical protein